MLHVDGREVAQTGPIVRYLAKQFRTMQPSSFRLPETYLIFLSIPDLAGMDKWEQLLADSALETTLDLMSTAIALGESKKGPLEKVSEIPSV